MWILKFRDPSRGLVGGDSFLATGLRGRITGFLGRLLGLLSRLFLRVRGFFTGFRLIFALQMGYIRT